MKKKKDESKNSIEIIENQIKSLESQLQDMKNNTTVTVDLFGTLIDDDEEQEKKGL